MRRRIPMSMQERRKEVEKSLRYLNAAIAEVKDYPIKTDLIGRALEDQVHRMRRILELNLRGIPFGVGKNK